MGFFKSIKEGIKDVAQDAINISAGGLIYQGITGDKLVDFNKKRAAQGLPSLTQEELTTSNVFSKLSNEQKKDLLINNPNIKTALGSQIFDPLTNTIRLEESDFTKNQRLRQEALAQGLSSQLGGDLPSTDPSARFEQGRELLAPQFQEDRERLEQQLADQGIPRGSEAFNEELNRLEQSQGRQLQELSFNSVQTSEAQRAARFNEISSLLGQQQVGGVGFGDFGAQRSGLDLFGAEQAGLNRAFQGDQARMQRSADKRNAIIGALGGLGSAGISAFSDIRLKENIELVDYSNKGLPIYRFDYINKDYGEGRFEGVMSQDLMDINPEAIIFDKSGYYMVDYSKLDVNFKKIQ